MAKLENVFSWSASRSQQFDQCRRAYYYQYYGSWGGWESDAPAASRKLYLLKNMTNLPMWAGSIVHETIADCLNRFSRTGGPLQLGELQARARNALRNGWVEAVTREWLQRAKKTNLQELYYGNGKSLPRAMTDDCRQRVYDCLDAFAGSPLLREIQATPYMNWKPVDTLDSFLIDDLKVWCAIDFAFTTPDGALKIIDWKTGGEKKDALKTQLACYAFYACDRWFADLGKLQMMGVFLRENARVSSYPVTPELLVDTKDLILTDAARMRECLADPAANVAREKDFPCCENDRTCAYCNYREVCPYAMTKDYARTPW